MECIWVRRDEIRGQLVRDASSLSHCNLVDYDWKTKVSIISQPKVGTTLKKSYQIKIIRGWAILIFSIIKKNILKIERVCTCDVFSDVYNVQVFFNYCNYHYLIYVLV